MKCYAEINDLRLYYEIHGEGEPLFLLHGGSASIESYENQIPALAKHFQVVAIDSRGHGRTGDSPLPFSYELLAEDTVALARHLGLKKISVLGWSDGGIIALHLAIHHPDLITKIAITGANFHFDGTTDEFKQLVGDGGNKDLPQELIDLYGAISPDSIEHWPVLLSKLKNMWMTSPNYTIDQLKTIKARVLIISGDRDIVKLRHTVEMFEAIADAQLCVIPGSSHFVPLEKPALFNQIALRFLTD